MISKKPNFLLSSCNSLSTLNYQNHQSHTPQLRRPSPLTRSKRCSHIQFERRFATFQGTKDSREQDDILWPDIPDPSRLPTPYQIFNQLDREPYSKRRFYELVKLYHPDRNSTVDDISTDSRSHKCSHDLRLERYRLIVSANAILSDPDKRRAYDQTGYGWSTFRGDDSSSRYGRSSAKYTTYHRWRSDTQHRFTWAFNHDPMYNATWEDWERWYARHDNDGRSARRKQQAIYLNNHAFISVVALLAALGGISTATKAQSISKDRGERIRAISDETQQTLNEIKQQTRESIGKGESRQERLRRFIQEHEGYDDEQPDGRLLTKDSPALCASEQIKDKDEVPFWRKPPSK